jgi:hypothetical protein
MAATTCPLQVDLGLACQQELQIGTINACSCYANSDSASTGIFLVVTVQLGDDASNQPYLGGSVNGNAAALGNSLRSVARLILFFFTVGGKQEVMPPSTQRIYFVKEREGWAAEVPLLMYLQ